MKSSAAPRLSTVKIRPLDPDDSVEKITDLLHRSYSRSASAGLRFLATHQDATVTRERLDAGDSFIAEIDGKIVGTITVQTREDRPYGDYDPECRVGSFGQFAVDPEHQGLGIGDLLIAAAENVARAKGCQELALDTAQPAESLIAYYERRGFKIVGRGDWRPLTNYESWILSKPLF